MNISVTKDNVIIIEDSNLPHENEYKITRCYFTFDEFTEPFQVKRAIFTILSTGEKFQTDIINNECYVPVEVLKHELETIKIGVYSFDIETIEEDGKEKEVLKQRTSPSYTTFVVPSGSYEEGALSPEIITPTQYDIYSQALQEGLAELEEGLEEVSHVDIDASKSEGVSTVTITNRHNEEKTVEILDGEDGYTPVKGVDYFTTAEIEEIEGTVKEQVKTDLDFDNTVNRINQDILDLNTNKASKTELENEKTARELADTNLQGQIDAITSSKDVVDIVGTYNDLQNYDTSTLTEEDVIKVLDDSTHNDAMSYYRWSNNIWNYIGSEGPFYTKSETDSLLNTKQATIDSSHKLASDLVDDTNQTHKFTNENEKTTWNAKYDKPSNGIPKSDLSASVQESLNKADSAIQDVSDKEDKSNKVTEINSSSTDTEYPSAKCVYNSQVAQDNEIDTLKMIYNILPTDDDTGETISIDNTGEMPIKSIQLGGNTSQVVIPAESGTNVNATSISISDVNTDKEHTIGIDGDTYQETTNGENLLPTDLAIEQTSNGVKITPLGNGQFRLNGTASSLTEFWIQSYNYRATTEILKSGVTYYVKTFFDGTHTRGVLSSLWNGSNYEFQISEPDNYNGYAYTPSTDIVQKGYKIVIPSGAQYINCIVSSEIAKINATSWDEYSGGQPSPNPDYPQDIEVVTGENDITICGKNLWEFNGTTFNGWAVQNNDILKFFNSLKEGTYTLVLKAKITSLTNPQERYRWGIFSDNFSGNLEFRSYVDDEVNVGDIISSTFTFTISSAQKGQFIHGFTYTLSNTMGVKAGDIELFETQLEIGPTSTTYEPYQGTTYPINLGNIELCKISTYKDRIYKSNDKWYLEKNIGKVVLNGSEDWTKFDVAQGTLFRNITKIINDINDNSYTPYSNYYKCIPFSQKDNRTNFNLYIGSIDDTLDIMDNRFATTSDFATWLSTHNTIVYYPLESPTTTEITDSTLVSQLNALANSTLYSTTNINTTTSNLLPYIDLQYNVVTPSPSPSRPSVVNVVKGENTLTISNSDDTQSQTYPINLPNGLELCKIGTYQDYIYKDNGNWYLHKETGKYNVDTSRIALRSDYTNVEYALIPKARDYVGYSAYGDQIGLCSHAKWSNNPPSWDSANNINNIYSGADLLAWWIGFTKGTGLTAIQSTLSGSYILYPLATPTNTQISDTTLITQLDNLQKAISYDSQTNISQTNEDKPFIITAEMFLSLKNVFE